MRRKPSRFPKSIPILYLTLFFLPAVFRMAAAPYAYAAQWDQPARSIVVAPEYTGVILSRGESLSVGLVVTNQGRVPENIDLSLPEVPKGWKARIQGHRFEVTGLHVAADTTRNLTFRAEPDPDLSPGTYLFPIEARSEDGKLRAAARLRVMVNPKGNETNERDVIVATSYPVLQGPTDAEFEFSVDVENRMDQDTDFNLSARGPERWEIRFKPAYEEKLISSLRIKAGQSRSMTVTVRPHPSAGPGDYPIQVTVGAERARAEAEFTVVLTGTHRLDMGTADGRLSMNARQGRAARISLYLKNGGSAPLGNIRLLSFKPENWEVTFDPEEIEALGPGDVYQVEASITPAEQALVGDYSVGLSARGERITEKLELRVTVRASTAWGWVGVGIIFLVILGLVLLFIRLGRR